jgi:predicted RNA-binding protein with PIN domain
VRWLVDGYNVIRRDPDLRAREAEGLETGRAALLRLLAGAARISGDPFLVVFDGARRSGGTPVGGPGAQVQVMFSRPPESADDVLVRLATQWREGAIVVSADRTVHNAARRAGAVAVTTDEFLTALDADRDDDGDDPDPPARDSSTPRGNPRRLSRDARSVQRVLRRLHPR